jgi:hypothetical protein
MNGFESSPQIVESALGNFDAKGFGFHAGTSMAIP